MSTVRADRPSMDLLFFQKPMSFLKASRSNTVCSIETTNVRPCNNKGSVQRFGPHVGVQSIAWTWLWRWPRFRHRTPRDYV